MAVKYAFGGVKEQRRRLQRERVVFENGRVNLGKYAWIPGKTPLLYFDLLKTYGEPGPWPWSPSSLSSLGQVPATREEIAIGAILTQNTNWKNVEKALENLKKEGVCTIKEINNLGKANFGKLKFLIKPTGFYNQKATYLCSFCEYVVKNFKTLGEFFKLPVSKGRQELLKLVGIGKETADTILLYGGNKAVFVVDAYTKRFAKRRKLETGLDYDNLQKFFTENLPKDKKLYQDYHALIVKWGKENK
jgi:endonuclease-3 related protein